MAPIKPKQNRKEKGKEKATVVEDLIPLKTLNKKIDSKAFKLLKESGNWNDILVDIKLLDGINGLTDSMKQQITEAVRKIIGKLTSEADAFVQLTVDWLEKALHDEVIDVGERLFPKLQDCARDFYSYEEMLDRLAKEFEESAIKATYKNLFSRNKGHDAYLQISSIRAAQRKAEQKDVGEEEKNEDPKEEREAAEPMEETEKASDPNEEREAEATEKATDPKDETEASHPKEEREAEPTEKASDPKEETEATEQKRLATLREQVKTLKDEFESEKTLFDEVISTQSAIATMRIWNILGPTY